MDLIVFGGGESDDDVVADELEMASSELAEAGERHSVWYIKTTRNKVRNKMGQRFWIWSTWGKNSVVSSA